MQKQLIFTIHKGVSDKTGKEYYYIENKDLSKRIFLNDLEVKVLTLLKLI